MYDKVIWPEQYDPRVSAIYALNDVNAKASPAKVWRLLIDSEHWSDWFAPENQVRNESGNPLPALGTVTNRVVVGFPMTTTVTEFVPERRLSWSTVLDDDDTGTTAYHGWVITPTADGCHVLTEETQQGPVFLEEIGRKNPGALYRYHQQWVEDMKRAAEA